MTSRRFFILLASGKALAVRRGAARAVLSSTLGLGGVCLLFSKVYNALLRLRLTTVAERVRYSSICFLVALLFFLAAPSSLSATNLSVCLGERRGGITLLRASVERGMHA